MNIDREGRLDLSTLKYVDGDVPRELSKGDVVFNNTNSPDLIGKTTAILIDSRLGYSNHMTRIRLEEGMSPGFVARQLHFLWMTGYFRHRCVNHVNQASISADPLSETVPLLLAPAAEQIRIADALDEVLSDLDAGTAALKRVRAKTSQYRASVLKAAVGGTVTVDWQRQHPHIEPASELLTRILSERRRRWEKEQVRKFEDKGQEPPKDWKAKYEEPMAPDTANLPPLPDGWCWATLGQLLDGIEAGKSFTCEPRPADANEWGVIKVSAMSWGSFDEHENKAVPKGKDYDPAYEIRAGDLLLSRSNTVELVGATVLVEGCRSKLLLSDKSMRLLYSLALNRRWLRLCLASSQVRHQMSRMATGTSDSMRNISQEKVASVRIRLPSVAEQEAIVEAVEDQLSVVEHLEADLDAKFQSAQALRQAILRHAFTGRLVPLDPNDEPAAQLLKRIAADREARVRESAAEKRATNKTKSLAAGRRGWPKKNQAKDK